MDVSNLQLRGVLRADAAIARNTWFQVGGPAEWLFKPKDAEDLAACFKQLPADVPVLVIGVGSNLLIRDGGVDGLVIRLGRGFVDMKADGEVLEIGAGCLDVNAAQFAAQSGVAGLEFLSGIPGTIGGAVAMNAGAYGAEIKDVLVEAEIITRQGEIQRLPAEAFAFSYRHARLPEGAVVSRVWLKGAAGKPEDIAARIAEIQTAREATQPIRSRTGGSTFKNPDGHKAWQLVDEAGCRGLQRGGAQVSEKHCNFLINTGEASAADIEGLGDEVRARVKAHSGIDLQWEIKRVGNK